MPDASRRVATLTRRSLLASATVVANPATFADATSRHTTASATLVANPTTSADASSRHAAGGRYFFLVSPPSSDDSAAMKASGGTSTVPMFFIRFLPAFCFSSSLRLRLMSPP